jgi:hypothetical protein
VSTCSHSIPDAASSAEDRLALGGLVGFNPKTPHHAAGMRIEPPLSVP